MKKHEKKSNDIFEQIFAAFPEEQKIASILSDNFLSNTDKHIEELSSSTARIVLLARDRVFVVTDMAYYTLSQYSNRFFVTKHFLKSVPKLSSFFSIVDNGSKYNLAVEENKVKIEECYFSYATINRFGKLNVATKNRNGFIHVCGTNKDEKEVEKLTNYIQSAINTLYQNVETKSVDQLIAEENELKLTQQQMWADGEWKLPLELFAQNCEENNVTSVSSERDYQKAIIIVENIMRKEGIPKQYQAQYITYPKIKKYFTLMKRYNEAEAQAELNQQIEELLPQEKAFEEECSRYAEYTGRDKSIRYCEDKIAYYNYVIWQCEQNEASVRSGGNKLYDLSKGRESSWAIHGGIASGIAGGAAGLAVAADVERKNVQIRQQNTNLVHSIAQFQAAVIEGIWKEKHKAKEKLQYWNKEAECANLLLVQSMDEQQLLSMLQPTTKKVEKSITGAVKLQIELQNTPNLVIYGNVRAVVDGSIKVLLKVKGKVVGSALCSLEYNGVARPQTIECICTNVSKQADKYDVSFEPYHLWALESK